MYIPDPSNYRLGDEHSPASPYYDPETDYTTDYDEEPTDWDDAEEERLQEERWERNHG